MAEIRAHFIVYLQEPRMSSFMQAVDIFHNQYLTVSTGLTSSIKNLSDEQRLPDEVVSKIASTLATSYIRQITDIEGTPNKNLLFIHPLRFEYLFNDMEITYKNKNVPGWVKPNFQQSSILDSERGLVTAMAEDIVRAYAGDDFKIETDDRRMNIKIIPLQEAPTDAS